MYVNENHVTYPLLAERQDDRKSSGKEDLFVRLGVVKDG